MLLASAKVNGIRLLKAARGPDDEDTTAPTPLARAKPVAPGRGLLGHHRCRFRCKRWLPAAPEHFPGREPAANRYGFIGAEVSDSIQRMYIGKRLPDEFQKQGQRTR